MAGLIFSFNTLYYIERKILVPKDKYLYYIVSIYRYEIIPIGDNVFILIYFCPRLFFDVLEMMKVLIMIKIVLNVKGWIKQFEVFSKRNAGAVSFALLIPREKGSGVRGGAEPYLGQ